MLEELKNDFDKPSNENCSIRRRSRYKSATRRETADTMTMIVVK